jgi:hypothetical protein
MPGGTKQRYRDAGGNGWRPRFGAGDDSTDGWLALHKHRCTSSAAVSAA